VQPRPAVFLQPHYDDVALSCGGTAALWADAGCGPTIVTLFASELVHAMVGEFARHKHSRWQLEDHDQVHAARRAEDARAAAVLGCRVRWLGIPDAIYRGDRYASDASLYGPVHPEEHGLADHLAHELIELPEWQPGAQLFVPLAIGSHVDHQLAFMTGQRLAARGVEVWAYEDLPYAIHTPTGRTARLKELEGLLGGTEAVRIDATLDRKLQAIDAYATQVPVIFRFTPDFRAAVTGHALEAGAGAGPAERFWRVLPGRQR
jgi:LmbE family N-acetylglucosaminyl deacetylase